MWYQFKSCLCVACDMHTDPCSAMPCGESGVCLPDGNSYKCKCSDGNIITTSCTMTSSDIPVVMSTTIVPTPSSTIIVQPTPASSTVFVSDSVLSSSTSAIVTTGVQKSTFTTMPSPSKMFYVQHV